MSRALIEEYLQAHPGKYFSAKQLIKQFKGKINENNIYRSLRLIRKLDDYEVIFKDHSNYNKINNNNLVSYYGKKTR